MRVSGNCSITIRACTVLPTCWLDAVPKCLANFGCPGRLIIVPSSASRRYFFHRSNWPCSRSKHWPRSRIKPTQNPPGRCLRAWTKASSLTKLGSLPCGSCLLRRADAREGFFFLPLPLPLPFLAPPQRWRWALPSRQGESSPSHCCASCRSLRTNCNTSEKFLLVSTALKSASHTSVVALSGPLPTRIPAADAAEAINESGNRRNRTCRSCCRRVSHTPHLRSSLNIV